MIIYEDVKMFDYEKHFNQYRDNNKLDLGSVVV